MRRIAVVAPALAMLGGCILGSGPALRVYSDDAGPPDATDLAGDAGPARADVDLGDPFSIVGLAPSRGPFSGGTRAVLRGRGFTSKLRVFIGGTELAPSAIFASDPTRAAIVTPPGRPGPADVRVRDDGTAAERVLPGGFVYDAFVAEPDSGATGGGTRITLRGSGTRWGTGTSVQIDGKPCTDVEVVDPTHLACVTPPGTPGAKDLRVTLSSGTFDDARDAFTYRDSPDGFRGGLAGGALAGSLRVLAFDAWTGVPLTGGRAIAGGDLASARVAIVGASGVAEIRDPALTGRVTVTVAAKCHHPMTYVDVPVDTVTVYLPPVLDPDCASGDPPSTGNGTPRAGGVIEGELVWPGGVEFQRGPWTTVPGPVRATERRAAYVFVAAGAEGGAFGLPAAAEAVTPESAGQLGYGYSLAASPGNVTVYALAGIEDRSRSPERFTPYVMGVARGVPVAPNTKTTRVDVPMTTLLDHALRVSAEPPAPEPRGPDRLVLTTAATLGTNQFAIFPQGTAIAPLPLSGELTLTGVPALDGALAGEAYVLGASAVTGASRQPPQSVVGRIRTTDSNRPLALRGFLPIPALREPAAATWGGRRFVYEATGAVDLMVATLQSAGGLVSWTIVAPGGALSFDLPDLAALPDGVGLRRGPLVTTISVARIDGFAYGRVRNGQLGVGGWSAYATDTGSSSY